MNSILDEAVRREIADVLVRYASSIDRRDWELFRTCFTEDCEADYGDIGVWRGVDEITGWMRDVHEPCGHTMHRITNQVIEPSGNGVIARSYVDAIVLGPDNQAGARSAGYYDDEFVATVEGWRIARRRFTLVLLESLPENKPLAL